MRFSTVPLTFSSFLFFIAAAAATSNLSIRRIRVAPQKRSATALQTVSSDHILHLTRKQASPVSHVYLREARLEYGTAPLASDEAGQEFLTNITFGTQTFSVVVDTGSSDTWVAKAAFTCVDPTSNQTLSPADCAFGPLYQPDAGLQVIDNANFNISYGDGEYLNGDMAYEDITLAGISVPHQEVGIVDVAGWYGEGVSSGLVGLAFPSITSAFSGDDPSDDTLQGQQVYSPIFTTMYQSGLVDSVFSVALSRDESNVGNGGLLAIGGIPSQSDVPGGYGPNFASTPIEVLQLDYDNSPTSSYSFYTIQVDGLAFGAETETTSYENEGGFGPWWWPFPGASHKSSPKHATSKASVHARQESSGTIDPTTAGLPLILDTGTTLNYLSSTAAENFNSGWNPPAEVSNDPSLAGYYVVDCTATPPPFDVVIGGQTFSTNPLDLVLDVSGDGSTCISGIQDGGGEAGEAVFILGDVWLKSVLAVFDVGNGTVQVASRVDYPS